MSRYGLNKYGEPTKYGRSSANESTFISLVSTLSKNYGEIVVSWTPPDGEWVRLALVRNSYGVPVDTNDGVVVLNGVGFSSNSYTDADLTEGIEYYYTLFSQDSSGVWYTSGSAVGTSVKNFGTYDFMWEHIPLALRTAARSIADTTVENKDLSDFIRMIAFEYDRIKTSAYLLYGVSSGNKIPRKLLPLMLNQLGIPYEPALNDKNLRVMSQYGVQLARSKGSATGIESFVKAFSGNDATVSSGKNIFLTYNDSSFEESIGNWTCSSENANLSVQEVQVYEEPETSGTDFPNRIAGGLSVSPTGTGDVELNCGLSNPMLLGIPVSSEQDYTFSIKVMSDGVAGENITLSILWFDQFGASAGSSTGTATADDAGIWTTVSVSDASPVGARFAVPTILVEDPSYTHYFDAAQFEQNSEPTYFEDARLVKITIHPNRINQLINPNFTVDYSGWSATNYSELEIVNSEGLHPHPTLSGNALEIYPDTLAEVTVVTDPIQVTQNEYYTFSAYFGTANYGTSTDTEDECNLEIAWYDDSDTLLQTDTGISKYHSRKMSESWGSENTVLRLDEIGIELDTLKFKVGDGSTAWNDLAYASDPDLYTYKDSADWVGDEVLLQGHIGVETDTYKFKIGNGVDAWGDISYSTSEPAWTRVYVSGRSPESALYAIATLSWNPSSTDMSLILDEALFEKSPNVNSFFDGTVGQEDVAGLFWEGTPNASRSYFYRNFTNVTARLKRVLPEQLLLGSTFAINYDVDYISY